MDNQSKELELANATIAKFTEQYVTGMNVNYQGYDADDGIECPVCKWEVARNDDYECVKPKHCPNCGTRLIY